jgi:predicted ATPase
MAIHTGLAERRDADYFGPALNRVARLLAAGHGGQILLSSPAQALVRHDLTPGIGLRDLGEHQLRDLNGSEQIFQVLVDDLESDFPPLRTLNVRPHNLPLRLTPFIGRQREVREAREHLQRPDVRILTLTGPGGAGKSRLGLQVAAELIEDFYDGVWFISLRSIKKHTLVAAAISEGLGLHERSGRSVRVSLKESLRNRRLLLVLDNFEHLLPASQLIAELTSACPQVKILVTSRAMLRVSGEHSRTVPPLELPDRRSLPSLHELRRFEAIQHFAARAEAVNPGFALTEDNVAAVVEICRRVDGLPLAIELAAAWLRVLSVPALLERTRPLLPILSGGPLDADIKQQTMTRTIKWSYDLLNDAEKELFRQLTVFEGSFTLPAVEAVCNQRGDVGFDTLERVTALADKSLIRLEYGDGEARYALLQTIREFGLAQLAESREEFSVRNRQADYYDAYVEPPAGALIGARYESWLNRVEPEVANLESAVQWFFRVGKPQRAVGLANHLSDLWFARGEFTYGEQWLSDLLEQNADLSPRLRAQMLTKAGDLASGRNDYPTAAAYFDKCIELYRSLGDRSGLSGALKLRGSAASSQGDFDLARTLLEENLELSRENKLGGGEASALNFLASAYFKVGDFARAKQLLSESAGVARASLEKFQNAPNLLVGVKFDLASTLAWLGNVALEQGEMETAIMRLEEDLAIHRELGGTRQIAMALCCLAPIVQIHGDNERSSRLAEEAFDLFDAAGDERGIALAQLTRGHVARGIGELPRATALYQTSLELNRTIRDVPFICECLKWLSVVASIDGQFEDAACLSGAAETLDLESRESVRVGVRHPDERQLELARTALGEPAWLRSQERGRKMTLDQAIEYALAWQCID